MKKILSILLILTTLNGFSQIKDPFNLYFTNNGISGNATPNSIIKIDRNVGAIAGTPIIKIMVNNSGYFEYTFENKLPDVAGVGAAAPTPPIVTIWGDDGNGSVSIPKQITALTTQEALDKIVSKTLILPFNSNNPEIDGAQQPSTTFNYKVKMITTNFTVPIARFNFSSEGAESKKGELTLFNSVGAGIGVSWGEIEKTTDANGSILNVDYTNTFSLNLGFLFSSGKDGEVQKNIFAPTLSMGVLDFQLGIGYELGTTSEFQKKGFLTLAYAIPISKLIKGKYYILTASKGYNSKNPLPANETDEGHRNSKQRFM